MFAVAIAAVIYYFISKAKELEITRIVKIAVGFFIVTSILIIAFDTYSFFMYDWPNEMADYRRRPIIAHSVVGMVFMIPILLSKPQLFIFSFCYVLTNYFLSIVLGYITGIVAGEKIVVMVIKFCVVLFVLAHSLRFPAEISRRD